MKVDNLFFFIQLDLSWKKHALYVSVKNKKHFGNMLFRDIFIVSLHNE